MINYERRAKNSISCMALTLLLWIIVVQAAKTFDSFGYYLIAVFKLASLIFIGVGLENTFCRFMHKRSHKINRPDGECKGPIVNDRDYEEWVHEQWHKKMNKTPTEQ